MKVCPLSHRAHLSLFVTYHSNRRQCDLMFLLLSEKLLNLYTEYINKQAIWLCQDNMRNLALNPRSKAQARLLFFCMLRRVNTLGLNSLSSS